MSINLSKGQKVNLEKSDGGALSHVLVGLGWDAAESKGLMGLFRMGSSNIDCDASVILCNNEGKAISREPLVYFGHLRNSNNSIIHYGDNLTGDGDGDDEQISLDLNNIPSDISKLVFVVNIYHAKSKNQHFGMINNAYIHLMDTDEHKEICHYNLTDNYDGMTGVIVGEIYRYNGKWKFNAKGQPIKEASTLEKILFLYK